MSETKYTTYQQHEPLRVPANWGTQEKRLIAQLEEIFDDLYRRFNRLKMSDLSKKLQDIVEAGGGDVSELWTEINQTKEAVTLKADASVVEALTGRVTTAEGNITTNAGAIALKADASDLTTLSGRVTTVETDLDAAEAAIQLKADSSTVSGISSRLGQAEADIDAAEAAIQLKASQAALDSLSVALDAKNRTYAQTTAPTGDALTTGDLWIDTDDNNHLYRYDGSDWVSYQDAHLDARVTTAESNISANAGAIALKANQTALDTATGRLTTAEGLITANSNAIALKASQSDLDTLAGRVTSAESSITQLPTSITLEVSSQLAELNLGNRNLLVQSTRTEHKSINPSGAIVDSSAWDVSAVIEVEENSDYRLQIWLDGATPTAYYAVAWYNSSGTFISRSAGNTGGQAHMTAALTSPANAAQLRVAFTRKASLQEDAPALTAYRIKLEKGSSATDYTVAPEDAATGTPEELQNSTLTIDTSGISMAGGAISLAAGSSLDMTSGGSVDINGSTGSIDLGQGSQISATYGSFSALIVNNTLFLPIVYSATQPARTGIFWAEPTGGSSGGGGTAQATMATPPSRTQALGGFDNSYGTPSNPHTWNTMTGDGTVLSGSSFSYTLRVPFYRVNSGSAQKTFYCTISRNSRSISFSGSITVPEYTTTWGTFTVTSSANLFASSSGTFTVSMYCAATSYTVYLQSNNTVTLTATSSGSSGGSTVCTLHYLP